MRQMYAVGLLTVAALAGCVDKKTAQKYIDAVQTGGPRPDELPRMLNPQPPFRYPPELYALKAQGNVTLRVFIDSAGAIHRDSTSVQESSGYPGLDSAAVKGSEQLRFVPAKLGGKPIAVSILLPVYFRHPDMPPLPGDTILQRPGVRRMRGSERRP